jgi:hypothetical protein
LHLQVFEADTRETHEACRSVRGSRDRRARDDLSAGDLSPPLALNARADPMSPRYHLLSGEFTGGGMAEQLAGDLRN